MKKFSDIIKIKQIQQKIGKVSKKISLFIKRRYSCTHHYLKVSTLNQIIKQTSKLVAFIEQKSIKDLSANSRQEALQENLREQEQEQEQQNFQIKENDNRKKFSILSKSYAEQPLSLSCPSLTEENDFMILANRLLESNLLSPDLLMGWNVWNTLNERNESSEVFGLKPIHYFLVVAEELNGEWVKKAIAITKYDANIYLEQLKKGVNLSKVKRLAALFTTEGILVQNGKNDFAFKEDELEALKINDWKKSIIRDCCLISGKIRNIELFKKQLSLHRSEIIKLWNKIISLSVNPARLDIAVMENLMLETSETEEPLDGKRDKGKEKISNDNEIEKVSPIRSLEELLKERYVAIESTSNEGSEVIKEKEIEKEKQKPSPWFWGMMSWMESPSTNGETSISINTNEDDTNEDDTNGFEDFVLIEK